MPSYDYTCKLCNQTFEIFEYPSQKTEECLKCGKTGGMVRLLGPGAQIAFDVTREHQFQQDQNVNRRDQIMSMPAEDRRE